MTKIDHIFCTRDWELANTDCFVQAISSSMSDHCPMLLTCSPFRHRDRSFKFESYWLRMPGFLEVVSQAWTRQVRSDDKIRHMHIKLSRTARALKKWSREQMGMLKRQSDIANEIILGLDQAQEHRRLTADELSLRRIAKQRVVGLATVRRTQMRQRSCLVGIRLGDANTRLFHLRANGRRRKNLIPALQHDNGIATAHQDKAEILYNYYSTLFTSTQLRTASVNWDLLEIQSHDLHQLDNQLSEEEIKRAVFEAPNEKALGPDGFTGLFYKKAWEIIRTDLVEALHQLFNLRAERWNILNSANIVLIVKKRGLQQQQTTDPLA